MPIQVKRYTVSVAIMPNKPPKTDVFLLLMPHHEGSLAQAQRLVFVPVYSKIAANNYYATFGRKEQLYENKRQVFASGRFR